MNTHSKATKSEHGSAMLVAIILTGIISFSIAGYLEYMSQRNQATMRSSYWNQCIPIAEAGIEDCLMNLNCNSFSNLAAGGWTHGTNCYYINRVLTTNYSISYQAVISGTVQQVTNTVTGQVVLPTYMGSKVVTRTVQVVATNAPLFQAGLVGINTIDFNNKTISLGCGDAESATNSGGLLNLNVVANLALLNLLDICLQGSVSLGPDGLAVGANAAITGIINANASTDLNVQFNSVSAPVMSAAVLLNNVSFGGQTYTYGASGDILVSSINLTGSQKILVTGATRIYVTGNVNIQNSASIYVAPGASLQLYVGGSTANISGNGVVVADQNPEHFQYYGLNSNTSVTFNGPSTVNALVYAPSAGIYLGTDIVTGGILGIGGSLQLTFNGAVVGNTVKFTTDTEYHYDEQTLTQGPYSGYVVSSWQEL